MAGTYLELTIEEETVDVTSNGDMISNGFFRNPQQIAQVSDISVLPNVISDNTCVDVDTNKHYINGMLEQRYGTLGDSHCLGYSNVITNNVHQPVSATSVSQGLLQESHGCHLVSDQEIPTECMEGEFCQDHFSDLFSDHSYASGGTDDAVADDQGDQVLQALGMIHEVKKDIEFLAVESDKKKNPPYLIDRAKITTKNNEPIKFCLIGAKVNQMISVTLRYTEEKYKNNAVTACKLHSIEGVDFNFELSLSGDEFGGTKYDNINGHPTAHWTLLADMFNSNEEFIFYITMKCLNSCSSHKENGKKMEIIFKLMDPTATTGPLHEKHYELRACKNVKRDYKEAFDTPPADSIQPESFITKSQEGKNANHFGSKEAKRLKKKCIVCPTTQQKKKKHDNFVLCVPTPPAIVPQRKYYLVQWPTLEKERNGIENIQLMGGQVINLESLSVIDESVIEPDSENHS